MLPLCLSCNLVQAITYQLCSPFSFNGPVAIKYSLFIVIVILVQGLEGMKASSASLLLIDLDIFNIMKEAKSRWLRPNEIHAILFNYTYFDIKVKPVSLPKGKNFSSMIFLVAFIYCSCVLIYIICILTKQLPYNRFLRHLALASFLESVFSARCLFPAYFSCVKFSYIFYNLRGF